jgi:hypothetical protein
LAPPRANAPTRTSPAPEAFADAGRIVKLQKSVKKRQRRRCGLLTFKAINRFASIQVSVGVFSHSFSGAQPQSQFSAKWRSMVIDLTSDHSSAVSLRYALPLAGKSSVATPIIH